MSSATTSESNKPTGRFVVTREKIEKEINGILEFERRTEETIFCNSRSEAEAYKDQDQPDVSVAIHESNDLDADTAIQHLDAIFSTPDRDPDQYIRSRLDFINVRLAALDLPELETPVLVYPNSRVEPSLGRPPSIGVSKRLMHHHLKSSENMDEESYQLAVVGELGLTALRAQEPQDRFFWGMVFSAKFESLVANYRHGETFTFGKKVKSERRKAGNSTGAKQTALFDERVELVRDLLRRPGVSNTDPTVQLENVKREIVALENPILLKKDGSLFSDKTIKWWISNAQSLNTQEANRLSARRGKKLA